MQYFGDTVYTIPDNLGFSFYSLEHILWLMAALILCLGAGYWFSKLSEKSARRFLWVLTALILLDEAAKHIVTGICSTWRIELLPLHLCSINIFVILAYMLTKKVIFAEVLCALCIPGAIAALLFPNWNSLPASSFMYWHSFTIHVMLLLFPALLLWRGFKPSFSRLLKALPAEILFAVLIYGLNKVWGTNFMFLNWAGTGNPLTIFESWLGNPGYLVGIPILASVIWLIMYGVPALCSSRSNRKKNSSITASQSI